MSAMRLFETALSQLGVRDRDAWRALAHPGGVLTSPYLLPDFADLVDAERGDVRVVIAEKNARPVGYFAFHAPVGGIARPAGAPLSDYQGFAAAPGFRVETDALLRAMGAQALVYDNWAGPAPGRSRTRAGSAVIDLSQGADVWRDRRRALFKDHFKKTTRRLAKAEREFGPARIVFGDPDGKRFNALRVMKGGQYRASGLYDVFGRGWTGRVFERVAQRSFGPLRGLTASLYFGERLAAVEMGVQAGGVYHSWIPAYDSRFASVSPGLLLLEGIIRESAIAGITSIDLGKGEQDYKKYYADYEIPLSAGRALSPGLAGARVAAWEIAEAAAAVLPGRLGQAPARLRRRWAQSAAVAPKYAQRIALMAEAIAAAPKRIGG
jgi:CelD/BcsL family acetyltransferase involved in cellulose biosynthesis